MIYFNIWITGENRVKFNDVIKIQYCGYTYTYGFKYCLNVLKIYTEGLIQKQWCHVRTSIFEVLLQLETASSITELKFWLQLESNVSLKLKVRNATSHWSWSWTLFVLGCMLHVLGCMFYVVCSTFYVLCCMFYVVCSTLYILGCMF